MKDKLQFSKKQIITFFLLLLFLTFKCKEITSKKTNDSALESSSHSTSTKLLTVKYQAKVTKVIDGDTIDILFTDITPTGCNKKERVRFIGVNTPELNLYKNKEKEYYSEEAFYFTNSELYNQFIDIQFDDVSAQRDKYNRLLAYIWNNNHLFNQLLIERGYGIYYNNFNFNNYYMNLFKAAQNYSKANNYGMWERLN